MKRFLFILSCPVLLLACTKTDRSLENNNYFHDIILTEEQRALVSGNNVFAGSVLNAIARESESDFVVSPISIYFALTMLCNGVSGPAQSEILCVLGDELTNIGQINEFCHYLFNELQKADKETVFSLANILAFNNSLIDVKDDYSKSLTNYYDALIKGFDFVENNEEALSYINNWVKEKTYSMIPSVLDRLDPSTALLLINAAYFKSMWVKSLTFDVNRIETSSFYKEDGSIISVEMMNTESLLAHSTYEKCESVTLGYGNGNFALKIVLPRDGVTANEVVAECCEKDANFLKKPYAYNSSIKKVILSIPKFITESRINLIEPLKSLGIKAVFESDSDLSLISDKPFFFNDCFQKTKIKFDENGSAAATATVVSGVLGNQQIDIKEPETIVFNANKPFVYSIFEMSTNTILFTGVFRGNK